MSETYRYQPPDAYRDMSPPKQQTFFLYEFGNDTPSVIPQAVQDTVQGGVQASDSAISSPNVQHEEPAPQVTTTEEIPSSNTEPPAEKAKRVELFGRAGRDPTVRTTGGGTKIAKFPLAVHETEEGHDEAVTNWFTVVGFRAMADRIGEMVKKGDQYTVIGYPQQREFRGKIYEEVNAVALRAPKHKGPSTA